MSDQIPELGHPVGRGVNAVHESPNAKTVEHGRSNGGGAMIADPPVLKSPFPYPGGKSKVADMVWERIGNVDNWCEPFCGTLAVTLRRPAEHFENGYRVETCNDANHYIVNFWRAVKGAPEEVAKWADNPVLEADLHARHKWLMRSKEAAEWRKRFAEDPDYFDAKIAGWWCWGQCCWIGGAWCVDKVDNIAMPQLSVQHGVNNSRPQLTGRGVNQSVQVPLLRGDEWRTGSGVTASSNRLSKVCCDKEKIVALSSGRSIGKGVNKSPLDTCNARRAWLTDWMRRLGDRLRLVRTCYGHWSRICDSDSTLTRLGTTGVFLDPPYPVKKKDGSKSRYESLYSTDKTQCLDKLRDEVLAWCRKWGQDPLIRVAVCGYEGDGYEDLEREGWSVVAWEANGGYSNQRRKNNGKGENAKRERIWFNKSCLSPVKSQGMWDVLVPEEDE